MNTFEDDDLLPHPPEDGHSDDEYTVALPGQLTPAPWQCGRCGEQNDTLVDPSAGFYQEYVEDCAVCCRPNTLSITIDPESFVVSIQSELEFE